MNHKLIEAVKKLLLDWDEGRELSDSMNQVRRSLAKTSYLDEYYLLPTELSDKK